jgi:site-specific DNA-methyltransferase (adenine-specific)
MNPYYDSGGISIYHGDCREILPKLPRVDLVLTDPPYPGLAGGIEYFGDGVCRRTHADKTVGELRGIALNEWIGIAMGLSVLGGFVFCSYHSVAELRSLMGSVGAAWLLTWHKRNSPVAVCNVPRFTSEFIWAYKLKPGLKWRAIDTTVFDIPTPQGGCMAVERILDADRRCAHPTQKPISLIQRLLAVGGDTVLDPFLGTGTTLVACKRLGRRGIGIEIEERYCEIAARRVEESRLTLFEHAGIEQEALPLY